MVVVMGLMMGRGLSSSCMRLRLGGPRDEKVGE